MTHTEYMRIWRKKNLEKCRFVVQRYRKSSPWMGPFFDAKSRCTNPNVKAYSYYGGRGVKFLLTKDDIEKIWKRSNAHLFQKPSLDRINPDGDYSLDNCQFIEFLENAKKRRNAGSVIFPYSRKPLREQRPFKITECNCCKTVRPHPSLSTRCDFCGCSFYWDKKGCPAKK